MEWGSQEEDLLKFEAESGITSPALANKPSLDPVWTWYYDEYFLLSLDRSYEQGYPLAISTAAINTYCEFFGYKDKLEFYRYMRIIDRAWLDCQSKRRAAKGDN
jgi:hypothetical protein